jgi:DNA topoisomerase-1
MGVYEGKFGPYVKCGTISASLPKDLDPAQVTIETALPLLAAKMTAGKTKVKTGVAKAEAAAKKAKAAPRASAKA